MNTRRWDGDESGAGIGDGSALAAGVSRLLDALGRPDWVTEEPEMHLLPHLEHGARPWSLVEADTVDGGVYRVVLHRDDGRTASAGSGRRPSP